MPLTCQLLYLWKAARKFKEGRKETKILFKSYFILGLKNYSDVESFPIPVEIVTSSRQYISHFGDEFKVDGYTQ